MDGRPWTRSESPCERGAADSTREVEDYASHGFSSGEENAREPMTAQGRENDLFNGELKCPSS